jgi:hypothetical protein
MEVIRAQAQAEAQDAISEYKHQTAQQCAKLQNDVICLRGDIRGISTALEAGVKEMTRGVVSGFNQAHQAMVSVTGNETKRQLDTIWKRNNSLTDTNTVLLTRLKATQDRAITAEQAASRCNGQLGRLTEAKQELSAITKAHSQALAATRQLKLDVHKELEQAVASIAHEQQRLDRARESRQVTAEQQTNPLALVPCQTQTNVLDLSSTSTQTTSPPSCADKDCQAAPATSTSGTSTAAGDRTQLDDPRGQRPRVKRRTRVEMTELGSPRCLHGAMDGALDGVAPSADEPPSKRAHIRPS